MATKKENEEATKEAVSENVPTSETTVRIKIPRTRKDEDDVFVSVNERTWLIKRGVEVEVPMCVAKVLERQEDAIEYMMDFESKNAKGN